MPRSLHRWHVIAPRHGPQAVALQVQALRDACALLTVEAGPASAVLRSSPTEQLYRWLDRRLFSPRRAAAAVPRGDAGAASAGATSSAEVLSLSPHAAPMGATARCWFITYDGLPADRLEEAVRRRLSHPAGMVEARVWLHAQGEERCLFSGRCALEHRSLSRSVQWVAAKLPSLLQAALARCDRPAQADAVHEAAPPAHSARRLIGRLLAQAWRRLWSREQWYVQLHAAPRDAAALLGPRLATIEPPDDAFWADPFLCRREGRWWLFFESLSAGAHKAQLCALELDGAGLAPGPPRQVLAEDWHLSYPFLLETDGRAFMIPESSAHGSVDLYECTTWPGPWQRVGTLLDDGRCADATVVRFAGRWWMFVTRAGAGGCLYDELHVYWADALHGPWRPHRLNPVKIDAASARPAGAMWVQDGCIHRAVQDCSTIYGGAVSIQRVTELDEQRFAEVQVARLSVEGLPADARVHTFNRCADVVAIDVLRRVPRLRAWRAIAGRATLRAVPRAVNTAG